MLTRSDLCGHRNATLNSRIPLSCSRCVGFFLSARRVTWLFINWTQKIKTGSKCRQTWTHSRPWSFFLKMCVIMRTHPWGQDTFLSRSHVTVSVSSQFSVVCAKLRNRKRKRAYRRITTCGAVVQGLNSLLRWSSLQGGSGIRWRFVKSMLPDCLEKKFGIGTNWQTWHSLVCKQTWWRQTLGSFDLLHWRGDVRLEMYGLQYWHRLTVDSRGIQKTMFFRCHERVQLIDRLHFNQM